MEEKSLAGALLADLNMKAVDRANTEDVIHVAAISDSYN